MFWEMMRGIYKKLFAEFFPRNLPMEDFAVPSRRLAVSNPQRDLQSQKWQCHFAVHEFHLIFSCTESYFYAKIYKCI